MPCGDNTKMSVSTHGWRLKTPSLALRAAVELLSSMRFSISLLTVICIASIIGTVLKQAEPLSNYVNQFGPFWADVFNSFSLPTVYSAWWFLLILAFLVLSTSLCIIRNTPKILADLNVYKESMREQSLKAFGHRADAALAESAEAAAQRIGHTLAVSGWKVKLQTRPGDAATGRQPGYMVAAKAGAANKLGYIAAHSAIVLVCIGGLLDGDLFIRMQQWFNGKSVYGGGGMIADIAPQHRLGNSNLAFRGNLLVAEGATSSTAILNRPGGVLIQDLPFSIELKKFIVEYYSTGMPKLFASDIVITDKETGEKIPGRVEVNHPVTHSGIEIYQSSFDDGGSSVKLSAVPMAAGAKAFEVDGVIGGQTSLAKGDTAEKMTLEFTALRVINVENFGKGDEGGSGTDVRKVDLRASLDKSLGAANKTKTNKELRNIGPSISYKLRDAAGQAREYHNYMLPVVLDKDDKGEGQAVFLLGMRNTPNEAFSYLRIPADEQGNMDGFTRLRLAMIDPAMRAKAVERYVAKAVEPGKTELAQQLSLSAARALSLFAGAEKINNESVAGLQAVSKFMEVSVPEAERNRAGEVLVRILNGVIFELLQLSREQAGLKPMASDDKAQAFMAQSVISLSDAFFYPAPMAFALKDFTQVQASVFQVARAPGKWVVYTGCLFLIIGVFAMLYVRERRLWVWVTAAAPSVGSGDHTAHAQMALSTNRKTMDGDKEFDLLASKLLGLGAGTAATTKGTAP
jgi:cytochrome c biogenesis protein